MNLRAALLNAAILDEPIRRVAGRFLRERAEAGLDDAETHRERLRTLERERRVLAWYIHGSTRGTARHERGALRGVLEAQRAAAFDLHASPAFHRELAELLRGEPRRVEELALALYGEDMRPAKVSLEILLGHMQHVKLARRLPDGRWCAVESM